MLVMAPFQLYRWNSRRQLHYATYTHCFNRLTTLPLTGGFRQTAGCQSGYRIHKSEATHCEDQFVSQSLCQVFQHCIDRATTVKLTHEPSTFEKEDLAESICSDSHYLGDSFLYGSSQELSRDFCTTTSLLAFVYKTSFKLLQLACFFFLLRSRPNTANDLDDDDPAHSIPNIQLSCDDVDDILYQSFSARSRCTRLAERRVVYRRSVNAFAENFFRSFVMLETFVSNWFSLYP